MLVHRNIDHLPVFNKAVVTIGTFDGVHLGHQKIIHQLKTEARGCGGESVIVTFHPHPRKVVRGDQHVISLLNTLDEKIELLEAHGIDHLIVVPFTDMFAKLSASQYVAHFLVDKIHPHILIIGYDHRFGHDRKGNYELLEDLAPKYGFYVKEIPEQVINSLTVSSTNIRKALIAGKLDVANENLGYRYLISGTVVHGDKRGRTIGYPTANIGAEDPEKLIPANGVYAVRVSLPQRGSIHDGMMNIGVRPTVEGSRRVQEVNILDFADDIYGEPIRISLYYFIREEKKFSSLEALKQQIGLDKEQITLLLKH